MVDLKMIIERINIIEENQKRMEESLTRMENILLESRDKVEDIHKHVPFVDWLNERRISIQSVFSVGNTLRNIGLSVAPILSKDVVDTITDKETVTE